MKGAAVRAREVWQGWVSAVAPPPPPRCARASGTAQRYLHSGGRWLVDSLREGAMGDVRLLRDPGGLDVGDPRDVGAAVAGGGCGRAAWAISLDRARRAGGQRDLISAGHARGALADRRGRGAEGPGRAGGRA